MDSSIEDCYLNFINGGMKIKYENNKWYWKIAKSAIKLDKKWNLFGSGEDRLIVKYGVK